jgi:hypothetical protein
VDALIANVREDAVVNDRQPEPVAMLLLLFVKMERPIVDGSTIPRRILLVSCGAAS